MLFHASISANHPERVARFLARIWGGEAHPFPPVTGAWMALAGDERGTAMEVYPFGIEMVPGETETTFARNKDAGPHTTTHHAIGTALDERQVISAADEEGWRALVCDRGPFRVVEVWLENRILVEVLTPDMQKQYLAFLTPANWRTFVAEQAVGR